MSDIPYMPSTKNLSDILDKIKVAQTPPRFTHEFLKKQLGFASSNDRAVVKVLKKLGFLSGDSRPTDRYNDFRAEKGKSVALAQGLREGWSDVFLADEDAHGRSSAEIKEVLKNVTGKSESVAKKMATTFTALTEHADFASFEAQADAAEPEEEQEERELEGPALMKSPAGPVSLHNDIHVHLPATSDVAVYTAIFRALREELLD